jgi:hypothetical protein
LAEGFVIGKTHVEEGLGTRMGHGPRANFQYAIVRQRLDSVREKHNIIRFGALLGRH